jgi:hypothetical protein
VIEFHRGGPIQISWYRVDAGAAKGERFLHLCLAWLLILIGLVVVFRNGV